MKHPTLPFVLFSLALPAFAQGPTVSVIAASLITATAVDGAFVDTQSVSAQTLPPSGWLEAFTPNASAMCAWAATATDGSPEVQIVQAVRVYGAPGALAQAHAGQNEYVVAFDSPIAAPARIVIRRFTDIATAGTTLPAIEVDTDDDGIFDVTDLPGFGLERTVTLSAVQPTRVRIRFESSLAVPGEQVTVVSVALEPANDLLVDRLVTGCVTAPTFFRAAPSFVDQGVDLATDQGPNEVAVAVVGLAPLGLLLPNALQLPCILLPAPDILILDLHIPLPPAVRPLTFYVQGVDVTSSGLLASDGLRVVAY